MNPFSGIGIDWNPSRGSINTGAGLPWSAGNKNSDNLAAGLWAPAAAEGVTGTLTGMPGLGSTTQSMYQGIAAPALADYGGEQRVQQEKAAGIERGKQEEQKRQAEANALAEAQRQNQAQVMETQKTGATDQASGIERAWRGAFGRSGRKMYSF